MDDVEKLKGFGLTNNQAKLLNIFIKSNSKDGLTFGKIKEYFNSDKSFYWEILDDLITLEFLTVNKEAKPWTYRYNESGIEKFFKKQKDLNSEIQINFEKIIKELSNEEFNTDIDIKYIFNQLKIDNDQLLLLNSLFSKQNGNFLPKTMRLQEIAKENGELKLHTIRYNLNNLEKRGFIKTEKIGRIKIYCPRDLSKIVKIEMDLHKKTWEEKERRMKSVIEYFYKKPTFDNEPIQKFKGEMELIKYLKLANEEILIIFPTSESRQSLLSRKIETILEIILNTVKNSNLICKILIDNQIKNVNLQIIKEFLIYLPQIDIRITSNLFNSFVIIIDKLDTIHSISNTLEFYLIRNIQTTKIYKEEFHKIWNTAEDYRIYLNNDNNYSDLDDEIEKSKKIYPISFGTLEKYELIDFESDKISKIENLIRTAKNEIILDFRITTERIDQKIQMAKEFYAVLIDILEQKPGTHIKLILYLDDWLIQKLDSVYAKLIDMVSQKKLDIRVPLEQNERAIRIIIDDSLFIDFMEKSVAEFDKVLLNRNITCIKGAKQQIEEIWKNSLDARFLILDFPISNELENKISESIERNPPVFEFGNRPITISGQKSVKNIFINLYKNATDEIRAISGPFLLTKDGDYINNESFYERNYYIEIFKIIVEKCRKNLNVKLIRNTLNNAATLFQDKNLINYQISIILELFPFYQIKKIEAPNYNFTIIDKKILLIFNYFEFDQVKLTIITNNLIINEFYLTFQNIWNEAVDYRIDLLSDITGSIGTDLEASFDKLDLQITLPGKGEIKIFDGKYVRYITKLLLKIARNEIYIFQTSSDNPNPQSKNIKEEKILTSLVMSYFWDVMKALISKKIPTRVIVKFLPHYLRAITYNDLKYSLDNYAFYQVRFSGEYSQANIIYGIFDNYLTFVMGDFASGAFQMLVINDINLRDYYKSQFVNSWNNSIDMRQLMYEYGTEKKKKLVLKSYQKIQLEKEYDSNQIRKLFPISK